MTDLTPLFRWLRDVAMATSFMLKICQIGLFSAPLFVALAFRNGLQYRHSDFKRFICDIMAILSVSLVNFGPVSGV